jgi:glutaredoxin
MVKLIELIFKELGKTVRTIPQIVIDENHIGGYNELTEYFADQGKINYKGELI